MEESVGVYPLALAYRNLAVYWNSEGDKVKADQYTRLALALDPHEPFNLIFAAAFMAGNGHGDEALKIAGGIDIYTNGHLTVEELPCAI